MKVYILYACIDYEGSIVKGVFSSESLAQDYLDNIDDDEKSHIDKFVIKEHCVK